MPKYQHKSVFNKVYRHFYLLEVVSHSRYPHFQVGEITFKSVSDNNESVFARTHFTRMDRIIAYYEYSINTHCTFVQMHQPL